jgi:hypothetical protein
MTVLKDWKLGINVEHVLRAQGADPGIVSTRNPALLAIARNALEIGLPLIEPVLAYEQFRIKSVGHERISLSGGGILTGKVIAQTLGLAERVIVMVGTVGRGLEMLSSTMLRTDPVMGLALDGLGSAAVEALVESACARFAKEAEAEALQATIPLNPGIETWPLEKGQKQIFDLLDPGQIGIEVTSAGMMYPQKSISAVIGIGADVDTQGRVCDFCSLRDTCRYQDQYA